MSKVIAYRCNYCHIIKDESEIFGIIPTEDLFNKILSYPSINKLDKTNVHYCVECYKNNVTIIAGSFVSKQTFKYKILVYPVELKPHFNVLDFKTFCKIANITNLKSKMATVKEKELEYQNKVKELSYSLREKCVSNVRLKVFKMV